MENEFENEDYKKWRIKLHKTFERFFKELPYETLEIVCKDQKVSITFDDLLYERLNINIIDEFS